MRYIVIDTQLSKCINVVEWDGLSVWGPPEGTVAQENDGSVNIGDDCILVNGVYQKS